MAKLNVLSAALLSGMMASCALPEKRTEVPQVDHSTEIAKAEGIRSKVGSAVRKVIGGCRSMAARAEVSVDAGNFNSVAFRGSAGPWTVRERGRECELRGEKLRLKGFEEIGDLPLYSQTNMKAGRTGRLLSNGNEVDAYLGSRSTNISVERWNSPGDKKAPRTKKLRISVAEGNGDVPGQVRRVLEMNDDGNGEKCEAVEITANPDGSSSSERYELGCDSVWNTSSDFDRLVDKFQMSHGRAFFGRLRKEKREQK
ncbi:hypothetical protein JKY72_00585 [Candidatus Gracilibacteria bacterium]|nr:hypothetical protein [Candidatus Gracilibacteria bacterium]